eukprot:381853_1
MCKTDLNYALAYPTVKMVMVADWRLGALRIIFMIATLIYIVVYALYFQRGYLDIQSPDGTVTATLQRPKNATVNATQFNYCNASKLSINYSDPLLCEVWPEDMILFPTSTNNRMFITTRVSEEWLTMNPNCIWENFGQNNLTNCNGNVSYVAKTTPKRYLAGINNYTIQITHAMLDVKHYELTGHEKYCLTGEQMEGKLLDSDGHEMKHFPANNSLIVTLQELLDASGTNLSHLSDAVDNNGSIYNGESMRHSGILLMVLINYDNTYATYNRNPKYSIKVIRIKRAEYKVTETIYFNETYRMIRDRHGVYISFVQGGRIGKFNFQTALICLVASLGLLGMSTLIVDSLMLYCCKKKKRYFGDKYNYTEQYAKDHTLRDLLHRKHKHHPSSDYNINNDNLYEPGVSNDYDDLSKKDYYAVNSKRDSQAGVDNMPPISSYNVGNLYGNRVVGENNKFNM